jgi:hypothetical protein
VTEVDDDGEDVSVLSVGLALDFDAVLPAP